MRLLLLTFDCLPRRWLGCYGSLDSTTRGFDRLAALGTIFENAISPDVRQQPDHLAGLSVVHDAETPVISTDGQILKRRHRAIESADDLVPRTRSRKRPASRLALELHDASSWLRDQRSESIAWVRHLGLVLESPPVATSDETPELLAQLATIDEELDAFLDEWSDCADADATLLLTASRGIIRPRPATRRHGGDTAGPAITDDLVRVPLLVLEGLGEGFGKRELKLVSTSQIGELLSGAVNPPRLAVSDALRRAPQSAVIVRGDGDRFAVRTADWLFIRSMETGREPGEGLLFDKPDDACDAFDMRAAQTEVARELDALIDGSPAVHEG